MKAMILAAGYGTRLWPLTEDRTKPAIPFLGKPLVVYSVEYVRDHGVRDICVNLHHRPDSITRILGDGSRLGVWIRYSHEIEILGTGGAIDKMRDFFKDDDFVVVNGKIVTDLDLSAAIREHREREAIATLVLKPNREREHFRIVERDETGVLRGFDGFPDEQLTGDPADTPLMFTGIQVLSPRIFEYIPRDRFSHTTADTFPQAIAAGELVLGQVLKGTWRELSTLERYLGESLEVLRARKQSNAIGEGSVVDPGATVEEAILWQGVRVAAGAVVRRAVLADGVRVGAGEHIENAVVVRAEGIGRIERGEVRGSNLVVPLGAV